MDPNANWTEQLSMARQVIALIDGHEPEEVDDAVIGGTADALEAERDHVGSLHVAAGQLAELVIALSDWIGHGGFLPDWFLNGNGKTPTNAQMIRLGELVRERPDAARVDVDLTIGEDYASVPNGSLAADVMVRDRAGAAGPGLVTIAMHTLAPDGTVIE